LYLDLGTGVQLASLHTDKYREFLYDFIITIFYNVFVEPKGP
jgi:hypothetical protein